MGVYPLLEDETCWFLAVDFDKSTWAEDALAFVATCRQVGLPRRGGARSGNGNLIALPLQHGPRQQENSVFLDDQLRP